MVDIIHLLVRIGLHFFKIKKLVGKEYNKIPVILQKSKSKNSQIRVYTCFNGRIIQKWMIVNYIYCGGDRINKRRLKTRFFWMYVFYNVLKMYFVNYSYIVNSLSVMIFISYFQYYLAVWNNVAIFIHPSIRLRELVYNYCLWMVLNIRKMSYIHNY